MARQLKPHCKCGVLKTKENTGVYTNTHGKQYFHYLCKSCDSKRALSERLRKMSVVRLKDLRDKHAKDLSLVNEELERRKCR